ncbi:hypothetical protein BOVMAS02_09010 [Streptococcus uberis]|nr:hypothetical protein AF63_02265 [Streptococcus uberis Ab71]KKF46609.1 hypothetical protein AF62_01625 [Streptococcus uberis C8329]KKF48501.1 hypothetical protein AF59_05180 [Streptococcus uberis C5072]KKF51092.1 hypothetical protein AF60_05250 [Streptococcus uberis S6261]KKF54468.1 hypothetical protein AF66_04905 [Streptococcus uberis B190]KKF59222.1 hypothetical protein AF69_00715 [Streptococcus uberis 6736]KKF62373.1 hypothetical protein AF58_05115 [Streptococcus uberis C6344]
MNFAILIPSYQPDFKLIELINALIVDDYLKNVQLLSLMMEVVVVIRKFSQR